MVENKMINQFKNTSDYKMGDIALINPALKLYTYHVSKTGSVQQHYLILGEEEFMVGIIYDIVSDDGIPYCQIKFLIGNEIFYLTSHESSSPKLKIINTEK